MFFFSGSDVRKCKRDETRDALALPFRTLLEEFNRETENAPPLIAKLPKEARMTNDTGRGGSGLLQGLGGATLIGDSYDEPDANRCVDNI